MLNVRFDYGSIGRLFGVPRKFLSQVGAFCASFASGHQIIDVRAPAFPDPLKDPVTVGINEEQLKAFVKGCCSDLVDLDTAQTITGAKTIQGAALLFTLADASQRTSVAAAGITVEQLTGGYAGCKVEIKNSSLELWGPASTTNSAALDFHKYGDSGNYTARIIESGDNFTFTSTRGDIVLTPASGHVVRLSASPSDAANATTSKNVATCGWVAAAFSPQGHDHDSDYAAKNHNHNNDYAAKNHTHSNYAAADHTHGEYAALADFNELAAEVEDCVTQSDLTTALSDYSTSSDIASTYAAASDLSALEDTVGDVIDTLDGVVDDLDALDFVTTDTAQTITGAKTIQGAALLFTLANASQQTSVAAGGITVEQLTGNYAGCKVEIKNSSLELWGPASNTNSAAIDFHKYGDSGNYTARIIESGDNFTFTSTRGDIVLTPASGHVVRLSASPSDAANATTSKNVATCGWVAAAFSPQGHDHDSDYAAKNHNHNNDYAAKNHTHSNYAAADHTHGEYAALADFNELAAEVEDCVTQSDLTTALSSYSTSSDIAGTYAAIADVEDLAGGLEDAIDVLDALDAAVDDLEAMFTNAVAAATFDVVTDVEWTGTVLRKTRRSVTITGGVVTAVGTAAITTIDTPAVVTWS